MYQLDYSVEKSAVRKRKQREHFKRGGKPDILHVSRMRRFMKPVRFVETGEVFESINAAARSTFFTESGIRYQLKEHNGVRWEYVVE